jgi:hypothetical protein
MLDEAATYVVWMRAMLTDMGESQGTPTTVYQDNLSTIIMATNGGSFKRTKHLLTKASYVRERIEDGDLVLKHMPTTRMVADLLTKPLPRAQLTTLLGLLGIK